MSERPIATLGEFMDEFVGTAPGSGAIKEVVNAVQGGPAERARTAVVDKVQESGVVPVAVAGTIGFSNLLNPVLSVAQGLSRGVGVRVTHRAHREEEVVSRLKPGETIDKFGKKYYERMGVSVATADAEIEASSGIAPDQVNDLPVGTKFKALLDRDVAVVPAGEGMAQVAEEHGMSLAKIEELNPSPNPNFVLEDAHLRLKPRAKAVVKPAPLISSATPLSKPKAPTESAPKKARVTIAPQPEMGFGSGLQDDLSQAFLSVKGSVAKDSHHLKMNTIHGVAGLVNKVDKSLDLLATGQHHKVTHHAKAAKNGGECSSTGDIPGSTAQQKSMNFFVVCDGYSTSQSAGVVGNLMQESSLRPEAIQNGGESQNPAKAGAKGWGIAQWTPGRRALSVTKEYGIKGPVYTLQTQLVMVAEQLKHKSPTAQLDVAQDLRHTSSVDQAAETMEGGFEEGNKVANSGGGQLPRRQELAHEALSQYKATSLGAAAIHGLRSPHHRRHKLKAQPRRDIPSSTEIYYEALKFNTDSYSETMPAGHLGLSKWEKDFPTMGPKTLIDCSGLEDIDLAILTHGKYDRSNNTLTILKDTKDWKREPKSVAGMGDAIEPVINGQVGVHIEIVKDIEDHGELINTFGAHTDEVPQPDQVGPAQYIYNRRDIFLRYIGPDAPLLHVIKSHHAKSKPNSKKALAHDWEHPLDGKGF